MAMVPPQTATMSSPWMKELSSTLKTVYRLCFKADNRCSILRVPWDVMIDIIFPQLLVEELLSLRQTCKPLYLLTHEPVIWRRYLRRLHGVPIAQMRPTFAIAHPIANYEIEHLVTTACALDRAWRRGFPNVKEARILLGQHKIVDLKLVPGGKFLVAAVKDRSNYRFFLMVYALDVMMGCRLLARLPTGLKAYDLQAKYLQHKGHPGIMISYTRRRFAYGPPAANMDLAEMSHRHPLDAVFPIIYEACAVHFRLDVVEPLLGPDMKPKLDPGPYVNMLRTMEAPFRDVLRHQADTEIHAPSLFEAKDEPLLGFIDGPSKLQFINLRSHNRSIISFADSEGNVGIPHRIRAFRYLPSQHGLLVVRTTSPTPGSNDLVLFEFYDFPSETGERKLECQDPWTCTDIWKLQDDFVISDSEIPGKKMAPDHPDLMPKEECPPTIWVFAPSGTPKGSAYWYFRPEPKPRIIDSEEPVEYHYPNATSPFSFLKTHFHHNEKHHERALAGTERTLLVELDEGQAEAAPVRRLRRFMFPEERFPALYPTRAICAAPPVTAPTRQHEMFAFTDIVRSEAVAHDVNKDGGLTAITWDENTGKICMAAENTNVIRVVDLAHVIDPHERLAYKWRYRMIDPSLR